MRTHDARYIDVMHIMPMCVITYLMYLYYTLGMMRGTGFSSLVIIGMFISVSYAISRPHIFSLLLAFIFLVPINALLILYV